MIDGLRAPLNGLTFDSHAGDGSFLLAEGGAPGRISRLSPDGTRTTLVDGLPGAGNYHTNMAVAGADDWIYFGVGAMTNLGIVGLDGAELAWLRKVDHSWDVPGLDLVLTGVNFTSPAAPGAAETVSTGAFSPFATPTRPGQRVAAALPCTAAVLRCRPDGGELPLHAWGLRNAFGLGFAPDRRLMATDQGSDDRGSRPLGQVPELVYAVRSGAWYGWPDFIGGVPVTDPRFRPRRGPQPAFVLANHEELPPPERPLAALPVNGAATKFDFAPPGTPFAGEMLVALFGDEKPMTAPPGPGSAARWCASTWRTARSGARRHAAETTAGSPPIDVRVGPDGEHLWILDFGEFEMEAGGRVRARAGSGKVWRAPWRTSPRTSTRVRRAPWREHDDLDDTPAQGSTSSVSFAQNIMPVLKQYNGQMIWRLDLTRYEDVRQNAPIIQMRIKSTDDGERMPPPPFPPFTRASSTCSTSGSPAASPGETPRPDAAAALLATLGLAAPRPALSLSKGAAHPQDAAATDEPPPVPLPRPGPPSTPPPPSASGRSSPPPRRSPSCRPQWRSRRRPSPSSRCCPSCPASPSFPAAPAAASRRCRSAAATRTSPASWSTACR